uniref:M20_dimer domain-containing protein n=1 Tax=Panagrellus redivivus TaxID=6233 RepID=A0A7E4ZWI5_PANRE
MAMKNGNSLWCFSNSTFFQYLTLSRKIAPHPNNEQLAMSKLLEYLSIDSVLPSPDYEKSFQFFKKYAQELELKIQKYEMETGKPIYVLKKKGTKTRAKAVMFFAPLDVAPTDEAEWTTAPNSPGRDTDGKIFARGTQRGKSTTIQLLEALRRFKVTGKAKFQRDLYLVFGSGTDDGAGSDSLYRFLDSNAFREFDIGYAIADAEPSETDVYKVCHSERLSWELSIKIAGKVGHQSRFVERDCGRKLAAFLAKVYQFRDEQEARLTATENGARLGDVTTISLTDAAGGTMTSLLPDQIQVFFNVRIPPNPSAFYKFEELVHQWCEAAGPGVTYEFTEKPQSISTTSTAYDDAFWNAFSGAITKEGAKYEIEVQPTPSGLQLLRDWNVPVLGFSAVANIENRIFAGDEYIPEREFFNGIDVYERLIGAIANLSTNAD